MILVKSKHNIIDKTNWDNDNQEHRIFFFLNKTKQVKNKIVRKNKTLPSSNWNGNENGMKITISEIWTFFYEILLNFFLTFLFYTYILFLMIPFVYVE